MFGCLLPTEGHADLNSSRSKQTPPFPRRLLPWSDQGANPEGSTAVGAAASLIGPALRLLPEALEFFIKNR